MKTDNELIAEFMGGIKTDDGYKNIPIPKELIIISDTCFKYTHELKCYQTWDWLMPVVEKIQSESGFVVEIRGTRMKVWRFGNSDALIESIHPGYSLLEVVFCGVVDFIKWHNQQSK